jgi:TolB-like protein/DNA-binding winged helix-turn-helix (wHTH) protein/Tfp pilus assembly protein PilF
MREPGKPPAAGTRVRFGIFDVDLESGEVWKNGIEVRLHEKPFQVLCALLERSGQVVSRKDLQDRLWPGDTLVEFENGLNNAISRLRDALGDSADSPRFIQTVPRRGYRFIAPFEASGAVAQPIPVSREGAMPDSARRSRWIIPTGAVILAVFALGVFTYLYVRSARTPAPPIDSVAVLPFATATAESPDDYIAFGMTEALIAELSHVDQLKVISQTSILRYKGTRLPLTEIAGQLGVGAIVEGSVVHEGQQVRITVQLIDASTDTHLWTETYRRQADTVLATQRDLAQVIAGEVSRRLTGEEAGVRRSTRAVDPRAHEAYLKGRYFLQRRGETNLERARGYFEEALAVDATYAPPIAGLADFYILTDSMGPREAFPKAREYASRAIAADEGLAAGHAALGYAYYYGDWNWEGAEREFKRALELEAGDSLARERYARLLGTLGRFDEAHQQMSRALALDPLSLTVHEAAAALWFNARNYDRMIEQANKILELNPQDHRAQEHLAIAHLHLGRYEDARAAAERGRELLPHEPLFMLLSGLVHHRLGRPSPSLTAFERLSRTTYVPTVFLAIAAAQTGRTERALSLLENAYRERDPYMVLLNVNPWFDPLRGHPRFQELLRAMQFPVIPAAGALSLIG